MASLDSFKRYVQCKQFGAVLDWFGSNVNGGVWDFVFPPGLQMDFAGNL